jgi:hypothetical protein
MNGKHGEDHWSSLQVWFLKIKKSRHIYHPYPFGRYKNRASNIGGSVMAVYDANGDGLNDVVSNLNAHGSGLAWFEQKRDAAGNITFGWHIYFLEYTGI